MSVLSQEIEKAKTIAIMGHVRPDGDCVGSTLALYNYIAEAYPEKKVQLYLEPFKEAFLFLARAKEALHSPGEEVPDLAISLDNADVHRIGVAGDVFARSRHSLCIDHHISNTGFAMENIIEPDRSSTAELLYTLLDQDKMTKDVAECLYLGIIHDTGVLKFSNTTSQTLEIVAKLLKYGFDFSTIIQDTYYARTYTQTLAYADALLKSRLALEDQVIYTVMTAKDMEKWHVRPMDLDGVVDGLRDVSEVEGAIFLYESGNNQFKVSMRSKKKMNVSKIAQVFGGGGHVRAAGCTLEGTSDEILSKILSEMKMAL